jgi:fission process protein 1
METSEDTSYDIWRDSPVRLLGYSNEVGESFRPLLPRFVLPSYILSVSYVACDAIDKTYKQYKNGKKGGNSFGF